MSEDLGYVCPLDQASIKKAKEELNENPQDRLAAVQALRDWIKEQPHLRCPHLDTKTLLQYLRGAKFSQIRAREMFEQHLTLRSIRPKWYHSLDTQDADIRAIIKKGFISPLPHRTPEGEHIILERIQYIGKGKLDITGVLRTFNIVYEYLISSEVSQVNGFVFLFDFTGVGPKLMSKIMTKEMADFESHWAKKTPGRFKAFHYYNAGLVFDMFMTFSKPFFPKKWIDRIRTHDTLETVYKQIPMECLPVEYLPDDYTGPNAGSIDDLISNFIDEIGKTEFRNALLYKTGPAFGVDESKKPQQQAVTDHFRKLNVD